MLGGADGRHIHVLSELHGRPYRVEIKAIFIFQRRSTREVVLGHHSVADDRAVDGIGFGLGA